MKFINTILVITSLVLNACDSSPKVIEEDSKASIVTMNKDITNDVKKTPDQMHEVNIMEVLQAGRYTYMKVKENTDTFWIATAKIDAKIGELYFYNGGLLKTNFESIEHKRVFDKIYLVSEIINSNAHPGSTSENMHVHNNDQLTDNIKVSKDVKGAIKLNELFKNKKMYEGKVIIVAGKCVKANYGILNKNWYHIQDASTNNGKICDFTITSTENIQLGENVAFQGKLILNKDFGAGYVYDILMEDGKLK